MQLFELRSSISMEPLQSTIDTGVLTDTTMQLMERDADGDYLILSDSTHTINIGDDLSLILTNGMYMYY